MTASPKPVPLPERESSAWPACAHEGGGVRRYQFTPSGRDGSSFAACAASLLAELEAVPGGEEGR